MPNDQAKLTKKLDETNKLLKRFVSLRQAFLRGIVYGLGAVLGATIVLSVVVTIGIRILSTLEFIPIFGNFASEVIMIINENVEPDDQILSP